MGKRKNLKKRREREKRRARQKARERMGRIASQPIRALMVDYHQHAFGLLHKALADSGYDAASPHGQRKAFWSLVPPRHYESAEARPLLLQYARLVEEKLAQVVDNASIAYWLHLYRRIAPFPVDQRDSPVTVGITRAVLDAAFQKYGRFEPCTRVGLSTDLGAKRILGGLLESPDFEFERKQVLAYGQMVLADFSSANLIELYDAEKLAFEIWRTGAQLRCVGKGAPLIVEDTIDLVADGRSEDLHKLVMNFDERCGREGGITASASGTVFKRPTFEAQGMILVPVHNLTGDVLSDGYEEYFAQVYGIKFAWPWRPNFFWVPFDLRAFYRAHEPLAPGFANAHGVAYYSVMVVLASLSFRVLRRAIQSRGETLLALWQKAYEGPFEHEYIRQEIREFSSAAKQLLDMSDMEWKQVDLDAGAEFWRLQERQRSRMDIAYPGPHHILLPFGKDREFVDYGWIPRRLHDLFVDVSVPDQNFKGIALEELVRAGSSVLPVGPCVNLQGAKKQIDAAFRVGKRLLIVECRAVGKAIAFDRGDPTAIRYRQEYVVDKILGDVDGKARWLATAPKGRNYDITWAEEIIPVGVTPFVEFIPSLATTYWLTDGLPRVLTPGELRSALDDGCMMKDLTNLVPISRSIGS